MITNKIPDVGDVIGRQNMVDEVILDIDKEIKLSNNVKSLHAVTNFRDDLFIRITPLDDNLYEINFDSWEGMWEFIGG